MVASTSTSTSLKEYLKRYENSNEEEKKKKKKRKKPKPDAIGVLVVDEDPIWQKPVMLEEQSDEDSAEEEKPQVDEDIEVKRMKRLEQLRSRRPYHALSEDGSGWVSVSDVAKLTTSNDQNSDLSLPRERGVHNGPSSLEHEVKHLQSSREGTDLSPPRQRRKRHHTPEPEMRPTVSSREGADMSPPQHRRRHYHSPSPEPELRARVSNREGTDLSPPRQRPRRHHTPSPSPDRKPSKFGSDGADLSTLRQQRRRQRSSSAELELNLSHSSSPNADCSPPRRPHPIRSADYTRNSGVVDLSPPRRIRHSSPYQDKSHVSLAFDLSPPRKSGKKSSSQKELSKTGLITGQDIKEENARTKKNDWLRFKEMDPSLSGRGAHAVYRDKLTGERLSKDDLLKLQKKEEKPKEKELEWGKGLAQKREAEAKQIELELEKEKPFARSRDDPDLDKMLKERMRWGDPMAHLVKKKHSESVLADLGVSDKMKESGFVIPQDIPSHSWIKRGLDAAPNRYGIRPGRHWDGVDRSTGFEKQMFKRTNEKQATEREAYLWSVSDM